LVTRGFLRFALVLPLAFFLVASTPNSTTWVAIVQWLYG
jgi:hypothetical protein